MQVFEAIRSRYSVRSYQDRRVEEEKLARILEAARLAPSAGNRQEWRFVVVRDAETRQRLMAAAGGQRFVGEADRCGHRAGAHRATGGGGGPRNVLDRPVR